MVSVVLLLCLINVIRPNAGVRDEYLSAAEVISVEVGALDYQVELSRKKTYEKQLHESAYEKNSGVACIIINGQTTRYSETYLKSGSPFLSLK